jgi:glycosyltransferase involved in cell wall biosynthesis
VGKQGYQKGYDLLLHSWKLVYQQHPDWHLEIYGTIAAEYKLQELAESLDITNAVHFFKPVQDIQTKYLDASIYAMSSRFEGFGMVLIEAMACGVPCVSFDCPHGPADIITHGEDGFLIENGNIKQMSDAIIHLIQDESLRIKMGTAAKQNVQRFLPENIIYQWDALFKSLMV